MHYSRVAIILFSTELYKTAFSTYSFGFFAHFGLIFCVSISFRFLVFIFSVLCFEFIVILKDVVKFV